MSMNQSADRRRSGKVPVIFTIGKARPGDRNRPVPPPGSNAPGQRDPVSPSRDTHVGPVVIAASSDFGRVYAEIRNRRNPQLRRPKANAKRCTRDDLLNWT